MRVQFIVCAESESFTPQLSTFQPNPDKSYTKNTPPADFFYLIKCFDDTIYSQEPVTFVKEPNDDDVAQIF